MGPGHPWLSSCIRSGRSRIHNQEGGTLWHSPATTRTLRVQAPWARGSAKYSVVLEYDGPLGTSDLTIDPGGLRTRVGGCSEQTPPIPQRRAGRGGVFSPANMVDPLGSNGAMEGFRRTQPLQGVDEGERASLRSQSSRVCRTCLCMGR